MSAIYRFYSQNSPFLQNCHSVTITHLLLPTRLIKFQVKKSGILPEVMPKLALCAFAGTITHLLLHTMGGGYMWRGEEGGRVCVCVTTGCGTSHPRWTLPEAMPKLVSCAHGGGYGGVGTERLGDVDRGPACGGGGDDVSAQAPFGDVWGGGGGGIGARHAVFLAAA